MLHTKTFLKLKRQAKLLCIPLPIDNRTTTVRHVTYQNLRTSLIRLLTLKRMNNVCQSKFQKALLLSQGEIEKLSSFITCKPLLIDTQFLHLHKLLLRHQCVWKVEVMVLVGKDLVMIMVLVDKDLTMVMLLANKNLVIGEGGLRLRRWHWGCGGWGSWHRGLNTHMKIEVLLLLILW